MFRQICYNLQRVNRQRNFCNLSCYVLLIFLYYFCKWKHAIEEFWRPMQILQKYWLWMHLNAHFRVYIQFELTIFQFFFLILIFTHEYAFLCYFWCSVKMSLYMWVVYLYLIYRTHNFLLCELNVCYIFVYSGSIYL